MIARLASLLRSIVGGAAVACIAASALPALAAEPVMIDMRPVLNTAWEDDGIPGNGVGGWSDEGVNDMLLWPPLEAGRGLHNGFPFDVVDPGTNAGKGVLLLAGKRGRADLPKQVEVAVPRATGRYLYLLMNATLNATDPGEPNQVILTASLCYADGSVHDFPLRQGIEVAQWWTTAKDPLHKPPVLSLVHLGENIIATGSFRAGVWATRLENPAPQQPVVALRFSSPGVSVPCVFAATLSDNDYSSKAQVPPESSPPPAGYFDAKQKQRSQALYGAMRGAGFLQGVRDSTVLRPDLVAVTFDNALTRDNGAASYTTVRFHDPAHWTISSSDDADYMEAKHPATVGHKGYERYNGPIGSVAYEYLYWNEYYVGLPAPMKSGRHYSIKVDGMESGMTDHVDIVYDDRNTISHAIKVNQVGYSISGTERWAYLGWWAGSLGATDYAAFTTFEVVDESNGKSVRQGKIELRAAADAPSGENVYQLDLRGIPGGRYHVVVPGLGRSEGFRIGADATAQAAYDTFRAFFHQRCGQELAPPYSLARKPACHTECWESGFLVGSPDYKPKPGEAKRSFSGGYHDAADYDVETAHLQAIADALMVYECNPAYFTDGQFSLPESGKGIPDILSEGKWALKFWLENQLENGAVPFGRGNDCDSWGQTLGDQSKRCPFGILPPTNASSPEYAAVAAQFSTLIRPYDKVLADRLIKSALKALDYSLLEKPEPYPVSAKPNAIAWEEILWALGECYRATGDPKLAEKIATFFPDTRNRVHGWALAGRDLWPLVRCPHPLPPAVTNGARKMLMDMADAALQKTQESAYRLGTGKYTQSGAWGSATPGRFGDPLARAHALTGEAKYLTALTLNYDYLFGVNPPAKTFVTGMGWNPPWRPEISGFLYYSYKVAHPNESAMVNGGPPSLDGKTVPGITIYGLGPRVWFYPTDKDPGGPWPLMHSRRDSWGYGAEVWNEFTVEQTIGPTAIMTLYLAAQDHAMAANQR